MPMADNSSDEEINEMMCNRNRARKSIVRDPAAEAMFDEVLIEDMSEEEEEEEQEEERS